MNCRKEKLGTLKLKVKPLGKTFVFLRKRIPKSFIYLTFETSLSWSRSCLFETNREMIYRLL